MPNEISLDDSSYDSIYEKAMERLHAQAPWWTHTETSDPGIMLLEMWAVLSDMQSFYLDQVQESHYRKYLKLLGVCPDEGAYARIWLFFDDVERDCVVPKGTKLLSDRLVFETEEEVCLTSNSLVGFYQEEDKNRVKAMKLSRRVRFRLREGGERLFSFMLRDALKPGEIFSFFVLLDDGIKRSGAEGDFCLVRLAWEYRTEGGWREAEIVGDDTGGLLFSGHVRIRVDRPMEGPEYEIRCRIKEGGYDAVPSLCKICLNVVRAVQRNTICCEETIIFSENCHRAALKNYLARTGILKIFKKVPDGKEGELWEDITAAPGVVIDPPVEAGRMERNLFYSGAGQVKVVCTAAEAWEEDLPDTVTGIAAQQISFPWENVMRSSVELMIREEGGDRFRSYVRVEPEEDRQEYAWHWREEETVIVLGDGRHGIIPAASEKGLLFTSLALWEGEKGNVSVGRVIRWERPDLFSGIVCTNRLGGRDGKDRILPSQQFKEMKDRLSGRGRMITKEDIRLLAMETPGLLIKDAEAEWNKGETVVKVIPLLPLRNPYCVERYRAQVEKYLEQFRLAGTRIRVEVQHRIQNS